MGAMKSIRGVLLLVVLLGAAGGVSCKHFGPGSVGARIVDCATQAIRDQGLLYVGRVNDVIGNTTIPDGEASNRLVQLGIDAGQDVLGCLLRDQAAKFGESATANPGDVVSVTAYRRANKRLEELQDDGWRFE